MPSKDSGKTVTITPDQAVRGKTGEKLTIIPMPPRCIVDSHSHIENGACAPLPLLWDKSWLVGGKTREQIDKDSTRGIKGALFSLLRGDAGRIQIMSTAAIGGRAANEMDGAFGPQSTIGSSDFYKNADLFSCTVVQMMDMEYAWIGGFEGKTIYVEDDRDGWYFFKRENARDPEEKWEKVPVPGENRKTFSSWKKQLDDTKLAIRSNPLRLFGMYHYEPRRWNYSTSTKYDNLLIKGSWSHPFNEVVSVNGKGLFIGFKMYPPLGYQPLDPRLPYLHDSSRDGDCFCSRCEKSGVPILTHCSPGGMSTHEMNLYQRYDGKASTPATDEAMPKETAKRLFTPEGYFWTNYVHPHAWREVLVRFPKLRLCLAHFGGEEWKRGLDSDWITEIIALTEEYDNVYTDFSCWDISEARQTFRELLSSRQHEHLRKKILFGTDWYMTLLALKGKSYKKFCEEFWEFFQGLPDGMELWERFTFVNPINYYGIFDKLPGGQGDKLDAMFSALTLNECDENLLDDNYKALRRVQKYYELIRND